ncbi:GUN4 domain-containing protein [Microcoleus sp. Pol11C2]|uniref:GUN4 domain-containing protein n=1 Tax=Microcoleus sp. Pol11C2 TaxID=3055389 RepID=UPI002FD47334
MIGKIRQIFKKFSILISRLPGSKKQRYYFFSVLIGLISFAIVGTGVLNLTRLIVSLVIFGSSKLLWDLGVNTPQESKTNLEDNTQNRDCNIYTGGGNYNQSIYGDYIQGDYIEIQGCYINTNQDLSDVVAELREVVEQLKNQGYSADKAEAQVAQDLEEKARSNPKVKKRVVKWANSLNNMSNRINNEDDAAKEVIKYAAASQYSSPAKSTSVVGGKYYKLDSLLEAKEWRKADEETENLILKMLGKDPIINTLFSYKFLSGFDIERLPIKDLDYMDKLWVQHSKGLFGFSVQKQIWESIVGNKPNNNVSSDYNEFEAKFAEKVGWYVKDDWIYYSDIKYSLRKSPRGHLPIKVMLPGYSNKCNFDTLLFRVFVKRQYDS